MKGSLKFEARSFKDWSAEKAFGANEVIPIIPLGRVDKLQSLNLPVVYQGDKPNCLSCSVTFIQQWREATGDALSEDWLAHETGTSGDGNVPSKVLDFARKVGIMPETCADQGREFLEASKHQTGNYFYFSHYDQQTLYRALKDCPLLIGVEDWNGVQGGHALTLLDVTPEGDWICVNWWNQHVQETVVVNKSFPIKLAVGYGDLPVGHDNKSIRLPMSDVLKSKAGTFVKGLLDKFMGLSAKGKVVTAGVVFVLAALLGYLWPTQTFGNVGLVGKYSTTLSAGITNTAATIGVSSVTLRDGETFTSASLQFPVYLTINPGNSTDEDVECWGLTSLNFTNCGRGLSWIAGSTTSTSVTRAFAHAAGEKLILSNTPYQYNRFAELYNTAMTKVVQNPLGKLVWNGSNMGWSDDGVNTYTFAAGGSGLAASTTAGIGITASKIYVNIGNGLYFVAGKLTAKLGSLLTFTPSGAIQVNTSTLALEPTMVSASYGDGSDGASTTGAGVSYSLTKDYYFTTFVNATGTTINTHGYRIFANNSINNRGTLMNNGVVGTVGNGSAGCGAAIAGGAGGRGGYSGSVPGGISGSQGGSSTDCGAGLVGNTGTSKTLAIVTGNGTAGGAGGAGKGGDGNCPNSGGAAGGSGPGGTTTVSSNLPRNFVQAYILAEFSGATYTAQNNGAGSGGGGGGGGESSITTGASGGGGGGAGGTVFLAAPSVTNSGTISTTGGNGGKGGDAANTCGGGGGGGAGGHGGSTIVVYKILNNSGSITATGGTGGAKGNKYGTGEGADGVAGADGAAGTVYKLQSN